MVSFTTARQALGRLFHSLFGEFSWQAPAWIRSFHATAAQAGKYILDDSRRIAAVLLALGSLAAGLYWYKHRPIPHYVTYELTAPALTEYDSAGNPYIHPLSVQFSASAARIEDVGKAATAAIKLSPALAGTWTWQGDRVLRFKPNSDWPIDTAFTVRLPQDKLLAKGVELESDSFDFRTKPFEAKLTESSFYQDPRDPNLKKLVATVSFTHPVDVERFERQIAINVAKDAEYLGLKPDSRRFTVTYDKLRLNSYVHSVALAMPRDDTPMTLTIGRAIRAERGGNELANRLETTVTIPGRGSLKIYGAQMTLVDNAKFEPEQVLMLTSSSPVLERALAGKVTLYLLPVRHPKQDPADKEPYSWNDASRIGQEILAKSTKLKTTYLSDGSQDLRHGFKFQAPVGRYLYVEVKEGVEGVGGYFAAKPYIDTTIIAPYKQSLSFLGEGALLSQTGDRKVGFVVRDTEHVQVEIGRVLPNQLQHFANSLWNFKQPPIERDLRDRTVERFTTVRDYTGSTPGKPTYDSIDLGKYAKGQGLFLLRLKSVKDEGQDNQNEYDDYITDEDGVKTHDERLILITDLGILVKTSKNGSRDVFVQSIRTGQPVDSVRIEVLGKNGQPVSASTTDATGRARLAKLPDLRREKTPLLLTAQKGGDYSFLPLRSDERRLQLSRFDVGGIENAETAQQLTAYLFTDRGIYRPGETAHLGLIARTADFKGTLGGLPIEVEITDSRGAIVHRTPLRLSPSAFEEITYTSQPSSPTGIYQATAYLPKDPKNREMLGSTNFKVQEFEPDRMKVRLDLSDTPVIGWLKPSDVKPRAVVAHLFGDPASGRRVEAELSLSAAFPSFPAYKDYRFQLSETLKEPYQETLSPVVSNDQGIAEFKVDLNRFASRAYRLNVLARAYEAEGGRNVAAQNSALVSDAAYLVGVKPDGPLDFVRRGSAHQAHWLAVNQQLTFVAAESLSLDWIERKYVSVLTQQSNQTFKYVSRLKEILRETRKVRLAAGGSNLAIPTQEPGDFVLVLRDAKGAELNRLSYTVAGEANLSRSLDRDAELQIHLDKPAYKGGDTIEASIRAPYTGAGLITIEREKVLHHQWFKTSTTSSVQRIVLPRDFEGNGYVNIQFVRDPASDNLFLSPLSYGVTAFAADTSPRKQPLGLTAAKEVKPGAVLSIKVDVPEASRIAVLAVDEGILQVARYRNPDPLAFFFQKHMLEVDTMQILDLILPDFQKFLSTAAPGGDGDGGFARHLNPFAKKRRAPVAYWSGLVDAGPGTKEFRYTVPDYFNGRIRIVAVAVSPRRIGVAESGTDVKGPFILTPNVPSMVAPGDELLVSVGVFNNNAPGKDAIRVEAQPGSGLTPLGPSSLNLTIADRKEGVGEFRFRANPTLGPVSLRFLARRGPAEARIEESISIRPAVAFRTELTLGRLDSSRKTVDLKRNLYPELRQVEASLSPVPLGWGQGLGQWLEAYPYSCTEQLVSKGLAALIFSSRPEFGTFRDGAPKALNDTWNILQSRANDRGGFGLWASSPDTAEFPTVHAALLIVEAKERGQKIPPALLANVNTWLVRFASTPAPTLEAARMRAMAVYLLVRQGIQANAALSNVEQELTRRHAPAWPTDIAAAWLASTYKLTQRNDQAERMIAIVPWSRAKQNWGEDVYYDASGHNGQLLYLTARHFSARLASIPPTALDDIATAISDRRLTSLSAAQVLLGLDAYAKAPPANLKMTIAETGKDNRDRPLTLTPGILAKTAISTAAVKVQYGKEGPLAAYYSLSEAGFDRAAHDKPTSNGIEVFKEFLDAKGNPTSRAKVGEEFFVRLRIRSLTRDVQRQVAIVDLLAGGLEPVIELRPTSDSTTAAPDPALARRRAAYGSLPVGVPEKSDWLPDHINVREDRMLLYGNVTKSVSTFVYRVRATNAGAYQSPPVFAEAMYEPKVNAEGLGGKLEIVKP